MLTMFTNSKVDDGARFLQEVEESIDRNDSWLSRTNSDSKVRITFRSRGSWRCWTNIDFHRSIASILRLRLLLVGAEAGDEHCPRVDQYDGPGVCG